MQADAETLPLTSTVDWSAAIWASFIAGAVSYLLYLYFVPAMVGAGNAAAVMRYIASIAMGPDVLAPPATMETGVLLASLLAHFVLALTEGVIIAFVLHRWGLFAGIFGGALFGLFFFVINFYTLTLVWTHMFAMSHWSVLAVHVVFGALAGGIYELLELEPHERRAAPRET